MWDARGALSRPPTGCGRALERLGAPGPGRRHVRHRRTPHRAAPRSGAKESRGGHYRLDYPARNDSRWKRRIMETVSSSCKDRAYGRQSGAEAGARQGGVTEITPQSEDFSQLVSRRRPPRRAGRLLAGQGLHGRSVRTAMRIWELIQQALDKRFKATGHVNAYFPLFIPASLLNEGEGARRGLRAAGRLGHARAATRSSPSRSSIRPTSEVIIGTMLREVDQVVARSARPHQPVGQRRPLGEGDAAVPADDRVPLAGRAHRARDRRRGAGRDAEDPRALQGVRRDRARDARRRRPEEREREVRRRVAHLLDRGADGRRPRAAGRHVAQPRAELRQGVRASSSRGATRRCSTPGRRRGACRRGSSAA